MKNGRTSDCYFIELSADMSANQKEEMQHNFTDMQQNILIPAMRPPVDFDADVTAEIISRAICNFVIESERRWTTIVRPRTSVPRTMHVNFREVHTDSYPCGDGQSRLRITANCIRLWCAACVFKGKEATFQAKN